MTGIARLTEHPYNTHAVVLKVSHELNHHFAKVPFAVLAVDLGRYLVATDDLPGLQAFANYTGIHIVDECSRQPGEHRLPPQVPALRATRVGHPATRPLPQLRPALATLSAATGRRARRHPHLHQLRPRAGRGLRLLRHCGQPTRLRRTLDQVLPESV
jgi:hypothetical protein